MDNTTPFQPWAANEGAKNDKELVDDAKHHRENVNHPKHTQTASYDKEPAFSPASVPGPSGATGTEGDSKGKDGKMDSDKIASMQQIVENTLSPEARQRVSQLLEAVEALSGTERLLLYLRLPTGVPPHDPLKQPVNPLGSRAELQQTVTWIQTHLEVDPDVSLPKQDVYDEYIAHCMSNNMKPLSTADFGKVMKQVYPSVRPRRLGTRGNSRYCYAGLRKKIKLEVPQLPDLGESSKDTTVAPNDTERLICDWAETKLGVKFNSLLELSRHLLSPPAPAAPALTPPPATLPPLGPAEDPASRHLMKQLKRKIQTQGAPGRPKKAKAQEAGGSPSTSAAPPAVKHESEPAYEYGEHYAGYDGRVYAYPPRAHPPPPPDYRPDPYAFEPAYDLTADAHLPINLSSDARAAERAVWRRRPPEPPPRLPLPGKKMILEAYQSEARAASAAAAPYLPKKMRAAESLSSRHAPAAPPAPPEPAVSADPKNVSSRSTSTAAALAREQPQAAAAAARARAECCLDIGARTPVICEERHAEILNRERVISICNIDKHDLDDYLNEGNSQENEEELLQYFHQRDAAQQRPDDADTTEAPAFLETGPDPHDEHSQGKNDKLCQLRELLAKNLKNPCGSNAKGGSEPAAAPPVPGPPAPPPAPPAALKLNGTAALPADENANSTVLPNPGLNSHPFNGNCHNVPQSPTTRTQQYDFVPISDGCHSPRTFHSKSPPAFGQRGASPCKAGKAAVGGSLQTSPVSSSTAASPFVSPRNTPVPRSRLCSRPIPRHNARRRRNPLTLAHDGCPKQFVIPVEQKFMAKSMCATGAKYCQPMSAPPSPNVITCQYKNQIFQCGGPVTNGNGNSFNFLPNPHFREMNGETTQPLSADPLSNEVSQFFQDTLINYRPEHESSFRSQSVPLKQGLSNLHVMMAYNKTPVGSVPPTPVPNEFCDFGSLADTCDISKACLNPETLDKIYDAIDSSNDVLSTGTEQSLLNSNETMTNGCELLPEQQILSDELNSLIPTEELLDRNGQFSQAFPDENGAVDSVEDFLKRTNSIEFDLSDLVSERNKFYVSRSVPSTPLPYKRAPGLQADPRRARELFPADGFANGISSKSVPSTPQLVEDKSVFSYSNRDYLINGNSVEACPLAAVARADGRPLSSPLHDMLRADMLEPLPPAADLLADLDKIEGAPYVDL